MPARAVRSLRRDGVVPAVKAQFAGDARGGGQFGRAGRALPRLFAPVGGVDGAGRGIDDRPSDGPRSQQRAIVRPRPQDACGKGADVRSEEHTSELQSLMRISYAVFCLKKKTQQSMSIND